MGLWVKNSNPNNRFSIYQKWSVRFSAASRATKHQGTLSYTEKSWSHDMFINVSWHHSNNTTKLSGLTFLTFTKMNVMRNTPKHLLGVLEKRPRLLAIMKLENVELRTSEQKKKWSIISSKISTQLSRSSEAAQQPSFNSWNCKEEVKRHFLTCSFLFLFLKSFFHHSFQLNNNIPWDTDLKTHLSYSVTWNLVLHYI